MTTTEKVKKLEDVFNKYADKGLNEIPKHCLKDISTYQKIQRILSK